jgi:hypothetical protein
LIDGMSAIGTEGELRSSGGYGRNRRDFCRGSQAVGTLVLTGSTRSIVLISEDVLSEDQHYTRHEKQNQYDVGELRFVESPIEFQPCPRAGEQHRQAKREQPDHVA